MLGKIVKIDLSPRNYCCCFLFASSLHALLFLEKKSKQANLISKQNQILAKCLWNLEPHDAPKMTYTIPRG